MFFEFDTIDGHHVSLKEDVIWLVTRVEDNSKHSEIVLAGGQVSIKISKETADGLQIALAKFS